jgi:hypothetical protein
MAFRLRQRIEEGTKAAQEIQAEGAQEQTEGEEVILLQNVLAIGCILFIAFCLIARREA